MSKILRYTKETISKYWNNENYRIFTLKMNNSGNLIVISSNSTNSRLYTLSENCIGKSLYEIMEKDYADIWHSRYDEWKKFGIITYYAFFEDPSVAWDTTVEVMDDTVFGIGKKVDATKLNSSIFDQYEFLNHYSILQEDFMIITLVAQPENDSFIIESVNSTFTNALDSYIGQDISSIMSYCSNVLDKKIYKKILQTKNVIHFVEKYTKDGCMSFFDIKVYPFNNTKLTIFAKKISESVYKQTQKKISSVYGLYPKSDDFGTCEINIEDKTNPYVIGCNKFFNTLLEETGLDIPTIISNNVFQRSLATLSKETGNLVIQNALGKSLYFQITVSHISELQNYIFLITLLPKENQLVTYDSIFKPLSKREKEIITYVVNGFINKEIASKLNIAEGTVKKTIYNSYQKMGIYSRVELLKMIYDN